MTEGWSPRESRELSDFQAWINITKGALGLGVLTMPLVIGKVGMVPATIGIVIIAMANFWGVILVAKCRQKVEASEKMESDPLVQAFLQIAGDDASWDSGLGYLDKAMEAAFGRAGQLLTTVSILAGQCANGVAFIATIAETVPRSFPALSRNTVLLSSCIILSLLSLAKSMRRVTYLSIAALLTLLLVTVCLVYEGARHRHTEHVTVELWRSSGYDYGPLFASVAFWFGNLPLADCALRDMRNKHHFHHVAATSYLTILMTGMFIGLVGYYAYGTDAEEIIFLNFPRSSRLLCVVMETLILASSFILHNVPVFMFLQAQLKRRVPYAIINGSVVCCEVLIAYLLPDVQTVIDTTGTSTVVLVSWLLPGIAFLSLSHRYERCEQFVTVCTMFLGIVGCVAAFASA